jgi:hypothetical protein
MCVCQFSDFHFSSQNFSLGQQEIDKNMQNVTKKKISDWDENNDCMKEIGFVIITEILKSVLNYGN